MSETPSRSGDEAAGESGRAGRGAGRGPDRRAAEAAERAATVLVNGETLDWPVPGTIADLLARLGMQGKRVAVSIDRNVIPRSRHGEAQVRAGDRIEILEAVGGG